MFKSVESVLDLDGTRVSRKDTAINQVDSDFVVETRKTRRLAGRRSWKSPESLTKIRVVKYLLIHKI